MIGLFDFKISTAIVTEVAATIAKLTFVGRGKFQEMDRKAYILRPQKLLYYV
jgi:hypothetical protein